MSREPGLRLYVLRHGEPQQRDIFYGHHDVALSDRGRAQARAQAERLGSIPFVGIYSSDLQRALQGAELIAERRGLEVQIDPALREMSLGALEGMPHTEARRLHPAWAGRSYLDMLDARMPGGGESVRDLSERVLACMERVARAHAAPPTSGRWPTVLVYAHNTVARVLLAHAVGAGPAGYRHFFQRYGAINRIDVPVATAEPGSQASCMEWARAVVVHSNRDPLAYPQGER